MHRAFGLSPNILFLLLDANKMRQKFDGYKNNSYIAHDYKIR